MKQTLASVKSLTAANKIKLIDSTPILEMETHLHPVSKYVVSFIALRP